MNPNTPRTHERAGASFTDFGGWEMPVEFDSIRTEHHAVRESAGVFDVSHMGQVAVTGPDAVALTDRLVTNDLADREVGRAIYAAITDDDGVMLDDTVLYRRPEEVLFVPNAGHDAETVERWRAHRDEWGLDADVENRTAETAMFALQGPEAVDVATDLGDSAIADLSRFEAGAFEVAGVDCWVARTGYTGEDGVEVILPASEATTVWSAVRDAGVQPCGLGARDTLRIEAGLLLSGQDFHPEENPRTPLEADIAFAVDLDGADDFVGADALRAQHERGVAERVVGLRLLDRGVPREGYPIETADGERVGEVTSGTMSPTLGEPVGLGYVPVEYAAVGTELRVVVRGDGKRARVVNERFLEADE
ncbi:glycine cleavage system protein T [Halobacteriales archaeon SW_5_70_135]|nr:MAG: glycine cleavage system protein T [Halobacteriales archaeon SW_5_70_135]